MTIQPINIKKSNINVNNYSFKIQNRHKTNALFQIIRNKSYGTRRYMSLSESHSNLSGNLVTRKTIFFNDQFNQNTSNHIKTKNKSSPKNKKKPIIQLENTKIDFGTIDSSDKYNFHLNKTEGNKISNHRISSKLLNKSELNFSFNLTHNKATNTNFSNNSKLIRSTENIFSYMEKSYQKKNLNKSKIFNNINDNSTNIINTTILSISKNIKDISELDSQNNSHIISSNTKTELKTISSPTEHIKQSDFICLAKLGKGSFSEVYLVQKINSIEKYVMKVFKIKGQNLLRLRLIEKNIFNHPFIVKLKYAFQTLTQLFLLLEYCPNGDLSKHLALEKRFKEQRAKFYICEILLALENLHKHNIIFNDLKLDNMVLDNEGHCKLTDFGLSKEGFAQISYGSLAYLAPKKHNKREHGKAIDWYLLGVLFYEMLVGKTSYFIERKGYIISKSQYGNLKIPNFVPKKAAELLKRLLERNPNKRVGGGDRDAEEIKEHPYFKDVDWNKVYEKKLDNLILLII